MTKPPEKISKIFVADMQILGSAFCFGIGFLGQRAVMVRSLLNDPNPINKQIIPYLL